jgi:hypothetical protein
MYVWGAQNESGDQEKMSLKAIFDPSSIGVRIARRNADLLEHAIRYGTFQARWYEDGTTVSHLDTFNVDEELGCDMVIGGHRYADIAKGRTETIEATGDRLSRGMYSLIFSGASI